MTDPACDAGSRIDSATGAVPFLPGDTLILTVVFRLTTVTTSLRTYAPWVDTYGQRPCDWWPRKL